MRPQAVATATADADGPTKWPGTAGGPQIPANALWSAGGWLGLSSDPGFCWLSCVSYYPCFWFSADGWHIGESVF